MRKKFVFTKFYELRICIYTQTSTVFFLINMKLKPKYLFAMIFSEIGGNIFSLFSSYCYSNLELSYMFMCSGPVVAVQATKINKYCGFNCVEWQRNHLWSFKKTCARQFAEKLSTSQQFWRIIVWMFLSNFHWLGTRMHRTKVPFYTCLLKLMYTLYVMIVK